MKQIKGGASVGSVASFGATMEAMQARPELFAVITNPFSLTPGFEGPSKEQQQAGFYEIWYIGSDSEGDSLTAIVAGDKDPGYGSTCGLIAESAICLSQKPKDK